MTKPTQTNTDGSPQHLDFTPTWRGVLPILMVALESGTDSAKGMARTELERMAALADAYVTFRREHDHSRWEAGVLPPRKEDSE